MSALLKNFVASSPLVVAVMFGYLAQPLLFVAKQATLLSIFIHEKLETKFGKEITSKKKTLAESLKVLAELKTKFEAAQQAQNAESAEDSRLANVIKNVSEKDTSIGGNVFILGKKDDGNKT